MKEYVGKRLNPDYFTEHIVTDPLVASLVRTVEHPENNEFSGNKDDIVFVRQELTTIRQDKPPKRIIELASQLLAIRELGNTANPEALRYLEYLLKEEVKPYTQLPPVLIGTGLVLNFNPFITEKHQFPHARGQLKKSLDFNVTYQETGLTGSVKTPEDKDESVKTAKSSLPHTILANAVSSLTESLGKK